MNSKSINVLLIEDNPGDVVLIRKMLAKSPEFNLKAVGQLSKGLGYIGKSGVDVVLLDLLLPDSEGLKTFTKMQACAQGKPIVVISGFDDETVAIQAVQAGAQDYLIKGQINGPLLIRSLRYALERGRLEQERAQLLIQEQAARAEAEAAQQRLAFLAEVSTLLASSLDYETTLQTVAQLAVPQFADYCVVYLITNNGILQQSTASDPERQEALRALSKYYPITLDNSNNPVVQVVLAKQPMIVEDVSDAQLKAIARDAEHLALLRAVKPVAMIIVPLVAHKRTLGAIIFTLSGSGRRYQPADLALAEELARRAALAMDNARLYADARHFNAELERRVAERTAELEHSLRELNQFTYAASHDLKAPLRGVRQLANWIVEDAGNLLPEASKVHLAKLQGRIQRMERLLNDLLVYSRVGRQFYQDLESINTNRLINEIIEMLSPPSSFTILVQENMPTLTTHRVLLELVFKNLIENAIKHHHRPKGQVQVSATEKDDFIEFTITDDGPGIDEMFHERIFEIFQTLEPKNKLEGTGAGLAIAKKAVESQGGAIKVISAEGQGATFRFTWPKKSPPI